MRASWRQNKVGDVRQIDIELTRRNLLVLLAKLDGNPPNSSCTLVKNIDDTMVYVKAVENDEHYTDEEPPGVMHEDTERAIFSRAIEVQTFDQALTDEEVRARYCSEGAFDEPESKPLFDEPTNEQECRRTCPGFSQCRDLGCERFGRDLHQGV